jgi:hypothetical protein
MGREFSLVLLGGGILTAGYFHFSDDTELRAKEEEQAKHQISGSHGGYHGGHIFFIGGGGYGSGTRSAAMGSSVSRGGFGGIGARAGG